MVDPATISAIGTSLALGVTAVKDTLQAVKYIKERDEPNKPRPVHEIVESLDAKLAVIRGFIKDYQSKPEKNNVAKEIERQIGNAVRDGEDVISRYTLYLNRQERRNWQEKQYHSREHAREINKVEDEAQKVDNRISEALANEKEFDRGNQADNVNILKMLQRLSKNLEETNVAGLVKDAEAEEKALQELRRDIEENVVGFVQECEDLVNDLIRGGLERRVISIAGMGGAGKTALAKKLYNDNRVTSHFKFRAWINLEKRNTDLLCQIVWGVIVDPFLENLKGIDKWSHSDLERAKTVCGCFCIKKLERRKTSRLPPVPLILEDYLREKWDFGSKGMEVLREENQREIKDGMSEYLRNMNGESLKRYLSDYLEGKKYLIVFDDMWDTQTWNMVKDALPADKSEGCRILITTRINRVVHHANSSPNRIRKLDATESLVLFVKQLFRIEKFPQFEEGEGEIICKNLFQNNRFSQVEELAKKLVEACQGLPLSIVQLADLLAGTGKRHATWCRIGDVNSYLAEGKPRCRDVLALSYHRLPPHLKQCLLYFGVFPKNNEIPVRQLIQFWIAEEFIKEDSNKNKEDIAEDYLEQLIDESLIQPSDWRLDGGVKTCVMHGLMQDLCMSESKKDKFLAVHADTNLNSILSKPQRLSLQGKIDFISSECSGLSSVRSFLCFPESALSINKSQWKGLIQSIELVRVLNLGDVELVSIPEDIGELNQLRYLKLKGAKLKAIPDSIHKLWNLLTLDLRGSAVNRLPTGIWKLQDLRHLYLSEPTKLPKPSSSESTTFNNLQVLSSLSLNKHTVNLITSGSFPHLRKLGVYGSSGLTGMKILHNVSASIHHLSSLQTLKIKAPQQNISLSSLSTRTSLTKITLVDVTMDSDLIVVLGRLQSLCILNILRGEFSNQVDTLHVTENFIELRVLQMAYFPIQNWILTKNAMQRLQRLIIKECKNLKVVPLNELTSLQEVHVHGPSQELTTMLEEMKKKGCRFKIVIHPAQQAADQRN